MNADEVKQTPGIDVGTTIGGRYEVVGLIGVGGCARVFKGREHGGSFCRDVAIKVLRAENFPTEELCAVAKRRLRHEAGISVRVAHHNVVTLLADGKFGGEDYIVLEYMPMTLDAWLKGFCERGEQVSFEQIKAIGSAIGEGLAAIHAVDGAIHRDIKPSNILLREKLNGNLVVKIGDLGLVKLSDKALTRTGEYIGTDGYTPADGLQNGGPVGDCRIDLFGLGCVLFEATTGHKAFVDRDNALGNQAAIRASVYRRPIPIKLDNIIAQLLEKQPAQRYATATDFLRAWADFAPDGPMLRGEASRDEPASVGGGPCDNLRVSMSTAHDLMNLGDAFSVDSLIGDPSQSRAVEMAPTSGSNQDAPAFIEPILDERAQEVAASLTHGPKKSWMSLKRRDAVLLGFPALLAVVLVLGMGRPQKNVTEPSPSPVVTAPTDRRPEVSGRDLIQDARRLKNEITRPDTTARPPAPVAVGDPEPKAPRRPPRTAQAPAHVVEQGAAVPAPKKSEEEESFQIDLTPRPRAGGTTSIAATHSDGNSLGVPATTTIRARLVNPISNQSPYALVVAELEDALSVAYRTVAPPGARLTGHATHQERGGKHFVEVRFNKLVDLQSGNEWPIDAVAMENQQEGLAGQVRRVDERNKSNGWQTAIGLVDDAVNAVDDALSGEAAGRIVKSFTHDQSNDARQIHRSHIIVTVTKSHGFDVMFRSTV